MTEMNAPSPEPSAAQKGRARLAAAVPWLGLVGFLVLGGAIAYVGLRPPPVVLPPPPDLTPITSRLAATANGLAQVKGGLDGMNGRLASVERKLASMPPPPAPPDLAPVEKRLGALEKHVARLTTAEAGLAHAGRPSTAEPPSGPNAGALDAALKPLSARIAALEKAQAGLAKTEKARVGLAATQTAQAKTQAAFEKSLTRLEQSEARLTDQLKAVEQLTRVTAAAAALKEGRPLGTIPGAPPALARYAATPPPTLSSLRLAFPAAARAELSAGQPGSANQGFVDQMRAHLGELITVREGDKVIVGNPATGVIAKARAALDAGELKGATDALGGLPEPLAAPMATWVAHAKNLLAAEAALSAFSGQS